MKRIGSILALVGTLAISTPQLPAHQACVSGVNISITDLSVQYALIPIPSWDCVTIMAPWSWNGLCLLADGTNCASMYGTMLVVSIPGGNQTYREIGNASISCLNGLTDQCWIIMPAGISAATFWFKSDCNATNACRIHPVSSYDCDYPQGGGTNAPPQN